MTSYAIRVDGTWQEILGPFTVGEGDDAVNFPMEWPYSASDDDRAQYGMYAVHEYAGDLDQTRIFKGYVLIDDVLGWPDRVPQYGDYTLDDAKAIHWQAAKDYRASREDDGCNVPGLWRVDTDDSSMIVINGNLQFAVLSKITLQKYSVRFKFHDNIVRVLNADQMIAVGQAATTWRQSCMDAATNIEEDINGAETPQEVFAIDITYGYPAP